MAIRRKRTIDYRFGDKHKRYIKATRNGIYNIAEGAVRAGKTIDNVFAFAYELKRTPDRIHLATGATVGTAKLNIGDGNGFGLEYIFRGQCRWTKYRDNEALIIKGADTGFREKIIIFAGGAKADSFKRIRGNSYGMWIATEVNLHHDSFIKEAFNRQLAAVNRKIFWDLNPSKPTHWIYSDYIDRFEGLKGYNYCHFTIFDNKTISKERIKDITQQYDPKSVWYMRDIEGRRVAAEGLIYETFVNHKESFFIDEITERLHSLTIGVDFGGNKSWHSFCATGFSNDFKKMYVLRSERIKPSTPEALYGDLIDFVRVIESTYGDIGAVYVDSAEQVLKQGIQAEFMRENIGIAVKNSIKRPIIDRIRATNMLFATGRIFFTKDCESLIGALSDAVYDDSKLEDERLDDGSTDIDSIDAFEYSFERYIKSLTFI